MRLPVRTALLQNVTSSCLGAEAVRLPVRTALLQNLEARAVLPRWVRLPVRTALLQNLLAWRQRLHECDYQSERHCSKTHQRLYNLINRAITSQNGTAPKRWTECSAFGEVRLPVRTALLQNGGQTDTRICIVRLPVRTALLQNPGTGKSLHVAVRLPVRTALLQNISSSQAISSKCDYQSERHCSKTSPSAIRVRLVCDYQSERHCSKTMDVRQWGLTSAITSQNGTAPKLS